MKTILSILLFLIVGMCVNAQSYKGYSPNGVSIFNGNRAVGSLFTPLNGDTTYLVRLFGKDPIDWTGTITDKCYTESYFVSILWWNTTRNTLSWEKQLMYIRSN